MNNIYWIMRFISNLGPIIYILMTDGFVHLPSNVQ